MHVRGSTLQERLIAGIDESDQQTPLSKPAVRREILDRCGLWLVSHADPFWEFAGDAIIATSTTMATLDICLGKGGAGSPEHQRGKEHMMDRSHSVKASIGALPTDYTPDRPAARDGESVDGLVAEAIVFLSWWIQTPRKPRSVRGVDG